MAVKMALLMVVKKVVHLVVSTAELKVAPLDC